MIASLADSGTTASGIIVTPPLGYLDFLSLMMHAVMVITDSGGIQEETTCLGVPCVTVRENTERPITVEMGTNVLAGTSREGIQKAISQQRKQKISGSVPEKWDGQAAARIIDLLLRIRCDRELPELATNRTASRQSIFTGSFR